MLETAGKGVATGEDGIEDGREIEGVEGRGGRGDDDGAGLRELRRGLAEVAAEAVVSTVLLHAGGRNRACPVHSPTFDTVNLQVNPPYSGNAEQSPQCGFAYERADGEPLDDEEICQSAAEQQRHSDEKEEDVSRQVETGRLRRYGEEGRYARACRSRSSVSECASHVCACGRTGYITS